MPSLRKDRGNAWWARVIVDGRQVACRLFPPGRKKGPEWTAAKSWEVEHKEKIEAMLKQGLTILDALGKLGLEPSPLLQLEKPQRRIPTASERLLAWGEGYLGHAARIMRRQTYVEKTTVMKAFFAFCNAEGIGRLEDITRPLVYQFLASIADKKGPNRANVYRKNLLSAWNWGMDYVEDFPQSAAVVERIKPFPSKRTHRYVPPEEDVIRVLQLAKGQDLVFLLAAYFTGARRGELFRLSWADVDLPAGRIRLTDRKAGGGAERERWLPIHEELIKALAWWHDARPCEVDNVFMQTQCGAVGQPYRARLHFMNALCARAGVKPFGLHAIRHKSAAITFVDRGLSAAQVLLGHSRATTTDIYVRSAGLYADQETILDGLSKSGIGRAVSGLLEKEMPLEANPEAFCTQGHVHDMLH